MPDTTDISGLGDLAAGLAALDDKLAACMRCGMCQAVCPVFAETMIEGDVARGKIVLLENLAGKLLSDADGVAERLSKCLLCGSCQSNCPSGVRILDIFLEARALVTVWQGLSPVKKAILRGMLGRPAVMDAACGLAARVQGVFTKPAGRAAGTSCARFGSSLLDDRRFVPLAGEPLRAALPELDEPAAAGAPTVAFFPGCLIDKIFPRVAHASLKALRRHGVGIFLPKDWVCCGIPAAASGDRRAFATLVEKNVRAFESRPFDVLVTACATCASTIRHVWPEMSGGLSGMLRSAAADMAARTMDINAFVAGLPDVAPEAAPEPGATIVAVHDPCHLKKGLGVFEQPRALIRTNPTYAQVEMDEADRCCGCGGSFNLYHYALSQKIGARKRENIRKSGAKAVAAGCPACMLQLSDMLSRAGDETAVLHPIEIYAETL